MDRPTMKHNSRSNISALWVSEATDPFDFVQPIEVLRHRWPVRPNKVDTGQEFLLEIKAAFTRTYMFDTPVCQTCMPV